MKNGMECWFGGWFIADIHELFMEYWWNADGILMQHGKLVGYWWNCTVISGILMEYWQDINPIDNSY